MLERVAGDQALGQVKHPVVAELQRLGQQASFKGVQGMLQQGLLGEIKA